MKKFQMSFKTIEKLLNKIDWFAKLNLTTKLMKSLTLGVSRNEKLWLKAKALVLKSYMTFKNTDETHFSKIMSCYQGLSFDKCSHFVSLNSCCICNDFTLLYPIFFK